MRQASRRSWRIGQTQPVQVVFMAYRNTFQANALMLVAKKLQSSLTVEGELPEDGLAAYGDEGDDLMLALARKLVAREEDAESIESVFVEVSAVGADADDKRDAADEAQRSRFSRAEFIAEEPGEAKRRRRDEAPTLSPFEWALDREREGALAYAGP